MFEVCWRVGLFNKELVVEENVASGDSSLYIVICVKRSSTKTGSLQILHNKGPNSESYVVHKDYEVDLAQAGHLRLLVRQNCQLAIWLEVEGQLLCLS